MKRLRLIAIGAVGALLALVLVALSGVFDVASSSRRSTVADWLWSAIVRQSVSLRSAGIEVPPLENAGALRFGAGHYDRVCARCHGSPAAPPDEFAAHLVPQPPPLMEQMENWRPPARVFWTVKHGIRHSAMPAWPTQLRDDEVWAVVAFITEMPEMSVARYTELTGSDAATACASCHGENGAAASPIPRLDIQSPAYLAASLRAFRDGTRASGIMMSAAHGLADAEIAALASTYGRATATDARADGPGADIALRGIPKQKVAPCESCHGPGARADFPRLAGQHRDYILNQLRLFATLGEARGGPHAEIMAEAVRGMTEADMAAVANWYAR